MVEKISYKAEKKNIQKGSVIISQGSNKREIYFLNIGTIEIKRYGQNIIGLGEAEVLQKSRRIGVKEAPSIFGVQNLINSTPHESSFLALSDCTVTKYIIPSNNYVDFFASNPPIALNILLTMQENARKSILNLKKYVDFTGIIDKFSDNLHILWAFASESKSDELYKKFASNGGKFPPRIESDFLTSDFSNILGKVYGDPTYHPAKKFDLDQIDFYRNLLKTNAASFIALITKQFNIFLYMFDRLSNIINIINAETEKFVTKVEQKLDTFFLGNYSSFNKIYSIVEDLKKNKYVNPNISKSIVKICRNIEHINKQLGGREYIEIFPKYDRLNEGIALGAGGASAPEIKEKTDQIGKYQMMLKDSMNKILDFSTLDEDDKEEIIKNIKKIKDIDPEQLLGKDTRHLIVQLQDNYFKLYHNLFIKTIKEPDEIPMYVKLFLYFSFIDENLVTDRQIEFIYNSVNIFAGNKNTEFPIIPLYDYLLLIYNQEEEPSLSEMGEFRKLVTKNLGKGRKQIKDTQEGKLEFEIDNMANNSMRITSDNLRAYIPFLADKSFRGNMDDLLSEPSKVNEHIQRIVSIDYSLFFRELSWKIPGKSELIRKEVKPYFILLPNFGSRVQMWQEMVYNIRNTRGRFVLPVIFNGDLYKSLVIACGHFRWNMNKALVSNWMDPVDGGLTGAYYDFEQTYKKNLDLTQEAKDKIKERMRVIKIDRDRFAEDYYEWIVYESTGVPKLNKVLRKIFYRLVPFPKHIRENVSNLPVYSELDRRFNNIRDRDFKKLESRFRKYKGETGNIPEDLQAYLDMMQA